MQVPARRSSTAKFLVSMAILFGSLCSTVIVPAVATYPFGGTTDLRLACGMGRTENPPSMAVYEAAGLDPETAFRYLDASLTSVLGRVDCTYRDESGEVFWTDRMTLVPAPLMAAMWLTVIASAAAAWRSRPRRWSGVADKTDRRGDAQGRAERQRAQGAV